MGNCFGRVFRRRNIRRHIVLILIGLDNAGKTKTVNNLVGDNDDRVLPTVGFKAVNLAHKNTPVTIYDLGGGPHFRQIWPQYYSEVHGIIFVIDSSDFSRLDECRIVLEEVLSHDKISGKPVLVLANKQDKNGALDDIDVVEKLNIEPMVNKYRCPTLVESYSAYTDTKSKKPKIDPGLRKGYQWLLNYIIRRYGDINLRVQTDIHADLERRKQMLHKSSNTVSQSQSDDIATQTGFENPNYDLGIDAKSIDDNRLIIVKPISGNLGSIDSTITVVDVSSADESEVTSGARPKLSPLFGRASNSSNSDTVRIELERKDEYRKLSPIVRDKSGANRHIDFKNRPQSSPTYKKQFKTENRSKDSSMQEDDDKPINDMTMYMGDRNRTWDADVNRKHRVTTVNDLELSHMNMEIILNDREYSNKTAYSDVTAGVTGAAGTVGVPLSPRPASASQLVRRQLELTGHKRRLSLKHMQRNKTSPERVSMLIYEPGKTPQRHLDKGDFEQTSATLH